MSGENIDETVTTYQACLNHGIRKQLCMMHKFPNGPTHDELDIHRRLRIATERQRDRYNICRYDLKQSEKFCSLELPPLGPKDVTSYRNCLEGGIQKDTCRKQGFANGPTKEELNIDERVAKANDEQLNKYRNCLLHNQTEKFCSVELPQISTITGGYRRSKRRFRSRRRRARNRKTHRGRTVFV